MISCSNRVLLVCAMLITMPFSHFWCTAVACAAGNAHSYGGADFTHQMRVYVVPLFFTYFANVHTTVLFRFWLLWFGLILLLGVLVEWGLNAVMCLCPKFLALFRKHAFSINFFFDCQWSIFNIYILCIISIGLKLFWEVFEHFKWL